MTEQTRPRIETAGYSTVTTASTAALKPGDREAIARALQQSAWTGHPVNIRVRLPSPFGKFYLVVLGGRERRSPERQSRERSNHRLGTFGNIVFSLGGAVLVYACGGLGVLLATALVEF